MTSGIQARDCGDGVLVFILARHLDEPEFESQRSELEISRVFAARREDDVDGCALQAFKEWGKFLPFRAIRFFGHDHGSVGHGVFIAIIGRAKIDDDREPFPRILYSQAIVDGPG